MAVTISGVEYVTAADVYERWGDVGADRLRDWVRAGRIRPVTYRELAAAAGLPVPAEWPDEPARVPSGRRGQRANLYRWPDVVEADRATRGSPNSRRRTSG